MGTHPLDGMDNGLDGCVRFDIHAIGSGAVLEIRSCERFGDQGDLDPLFVLVQVRDGEGGAVDCDGAFGDHPFHVESRETDADAVFVRCGHAENGPYAVDVTLDLVSIETVSHAEGAFEVDAWSMCRWWFS